MFGNLLALDHFNLQVQEGEIVGLLGPNSSGKTTAINCILALLKYDKGTIEIFGQPMEPAAYHLKQKIGVVPQNVAIFGELTAQENIDYFCGLYIKDKIKRKKLVNEALEFVGLEKYRDYYPFKLSGGLLRRLNIVEIYYLDPDQLSAIRQLPGVSKVHYSDHLLSVYYDGGEHNLLHLLDHLRREKIDFNRVFTERPTLNDVFLEITGKQLRA